MDKEIQITVPPSAQGQRLDKFLKLLLPQLSRTRLQQLIKKRKVTVGGSFPAPHYEVKARDPITVIIPAPAPFRLQPEPIPLDILYEDEHLLVINKQYDLLIHPVPGTDSGTLVNALLHHCTDLSGVGGYQKPGIVHRLDKHTSGCLVIAKHDQAHQALARQFKDRRVHKEYLAVCWGTLDRKTDRIVTQIGRDQHHRNRMSTLPVKGREAISQYEVTAEFGLASQVKVTILTGRTHQIRVHLSHLGHPVVGDSEYGGGTKIIGQLKKDHQPIAKHCLKLIRRQALHAHQLTFQHPATGQEMSFTAPLPDDIQALLAFLCKTE